MRNTLKLGPCLFGLLPFAVGGLMNWAIMEQPDKVLPFPEIAIILLVCWGLLSYSMRAKFTRKQLLCSMHLIPAVILVLVAVQILVFQAYWRNPVGLWTQLYYLPFMNLGFLFAFWIPSMLGAYTACFLLMLGTAFLGMKLRERQGGCI